MQEIPNKENLLNKERSQEIVQNARDANALLQKELIVNHSEQTLLCKRMQIMKDFMSDLPASDPQYNMIALALHMDQIELHELKARESALVERLEQL